MVEVFDDSVDLELVRRLKEGQEEYFPVLWNKIERLVKMKARRILNSRINFGVEEDDMLQAGRIALWATVKQYDKSAGCGFITFFMYKLKNEFRAACQYGGQAQARDPIKTSFSLDAKVSKDEGVDLTLADVTPDHDSDLPFLEVERMIWNRELHDALEREFSKLGQRRTDVLRKRYFEGKTLSQTAQEYGCSQSYIRDLERSALERLEHKKSLMAFLDERTDFNRRVSLDLFKRTNTSAVEWNVLKREELTQYYRRRSAGEI